MNEFTKANKLLSPFWFILKIQLHCFIFIMFKLVHSEQQIELHWWEWEEDKLFFLYLTVSSPL